MKYILTTLAPVPRLTRVTDGAECVRFSKQLAVLAYLTSRPEARATRDELVGLLWSGSSQQDGRRALRQVVYQIRHATDHDLLRGEAVLSLRREDIEADADLFRQLLAAGHLDVALALYEQDFLANLALAGAREFEQWAEGVRALLAAERRQLLRTLIARETDAAGWVAASRYVEQLIAADPSSLEARVKLIELLALSGDVLRARAAAEEARSLAAETSGETPSQAVEEAIARALAPSAAPERRQAEGFPRNPEMVGRATVFHAMVEKWRSAREGRGGAVLITGEAGIGKTRMARELARRINQDRSLVLETTCYALEQSDPLGPFLELLRAAHAAPGLAGATPTSLEILAALVPDIAGRFRSAIEPRLPPIPPQAVASALLEGFGAIGDEAPLALIVEDLHWAAPATIEFAHRLARHARAHSLMLVLTAREHAPTLETTRALRALVTSGTVAEIALAPLDKLDVENLLGSIAELPPEVSGSLPDDLMEHTGGIPLYVLEVLKELHDTGYLFVHEGRWTLSEKAAREPSGLPLQASGTDILRVRLKKLGGMLPEVLTALAVWGREAHLTTVAEMSGLEPGQVEEAISTLERRRLAGRRDGLPVVAHDEIAAAALDIAPVEQVLRYHARAAAIAAELAARGRVPEWTVAAMHAAAAGDAGPATDWAARGAREVERVSGHVAGREVLSRVLEASPDVVRSQLESALGRVLDGSWSVRRWIEERDGTRRRRRFVALAAGLAVLIGGGWTLDLMLGSRAAPSPLGGGFIALAGLAEGQPGPVLALRVDSQLVAHDVPAESLPPGLRAGFAQNLVRPDHRIAAFTCSFPGVDPTVTCARDLVTSRSTMLTGLGGDARLVSWLPDGSGFVLTGGYVAPGGDYARALLLADSGGRILDTLARDGREYLSASVAPSGDRMLVWRTAGDSSETVLMRLDGTVEGRLGWCRGEASWSPRGGRVACDGDGAGVLVVGDGRPGSTPSRYELPGGYVNFVWSPDGSYIAATTGGPAPALYMVNGRGVGQENVVRRLTAPMRVLGWSPSAPPAMARRITVHPGRVPLVPGARLSLTVSAFDPGGSRIPPPPFLHWTSRDSTIARVDSVGVVTGDRPGVTSIRASTGLYVHGDAEVLVGRGAHPIVLQEDFDRGLDTSRWRPFGYPVPTVRRGAGRGGSAGFWNRGDYSHSSGVVYRRMLDLERGLTVEYWAKVPFTGPRWQETQVGLYAAPQDSFRLSRGSPAPPKAYALVAEGPFVERRSRTAGVSSPAGSARIALPAWLQDGGWHRYRLAVYPSGEVRWFADGRSLASIYVDLKMMPRATLVIQGRSVNTLAMVDDVRVWEGVVLDSLQPARHTSRRVSGRTTP